MQFKLKDIFVEATQWFKHGDHPAVIARTPMDGNTDSAKAVIPSDNGDAEVNPGDFIVTDKNGVVGPIPSDVFTANYEAVQEKLAQNVSGDNAKLQAGELTQAQSTANAAPNIPGY